MGDVNNRLTNALAVWTCIILALLLVVVKGCLGAEIEYSDEEIVSAIYIIEGGNNTKYPYGIRSVHCENIKECRQVCRNTVKNNRRRYKKAGVSGTQDFIRFLADRYCPLSARNDPEGLNQYWIRNVKWFLNKENKGDEMKYKKRLAKLARRQKEYDGLIPDKRKGMTRPGSTRK